MMLIFARVCDGETLPLVLDPRSSIRLVKEKISGISRFPSALQRVSYHGSPLNDEESLLDIGIEDLACLDVNCDLLGGAKKRKKKVYSTPKKIKHKKKKVQLATLKFYKVGL
ncbi:unnamed protein product [Dicrocoelium dendriticum]|nr:unnamed protein product [Dicrocoelium dendriticum]